MSFPWQYAGVAYTPRDARHYLPQGSHTLTAIETYRAIERSKPLLRDDSLKVRVLPLSLREFENGKDIPWDKVS